MQKSFFNQVIAWIISKSGQEKKPATRTSHQHGIPVKIQKLPPDVVWDKVLTPKEREVLALFCLGYKQGQIAELMGVSVSTVSTHLRHISHKMGYKKRQQLRVLLREWDFSEWDPQRK